MTLHHGTGQVLRTMHTSDLSWKMRYLTPAQHEGDSSSSISPSAEGPKPEGKPSSRGVKKCSSQPTSGKRPTMAGPRGLTWHLWLWPVETTSTSANAQRWQGPEGSPGTCGCGLWRPPQLRQTPNDGRAQRAHLAPVAVACGDHLNSGKRPT